MEIDLNIFLKGGEQNTNDYLETSIFIVPYFCIITPLNKAPERYCALQILIYAAYSSAAVLRHPYFLED